TFSTYTVGGVKTVLFATSMDGGAYAINSRTGAFLWNWAFSPIGDFITGAPGGIFQEFNPSVPTPNSIFIGENCFATGSGCSFPGRSTLVALDPNLGTSLWAYDGSADSLQIGTISGQPQVENSTS